MRRKPAWLLPTLLVFAIGACAGAASTTGPSPTPTPPAGGPVTTEAEAVARVIATEPRFAGIRPRDPELIGQTAWFEAAPASGVGAFIVTMRIGWGDCQAGCVEEHTWLYAVGPDGSVTLQSEGGGNVPPDAWPAPGAAENGDTGIQVVAVAGPTCPVERDPPDPACAPRPVPDVAVLIFDGAGTKAGSVVLDSAGRRFVNLPPGAYTVHAEAVGGFMSGPEAQRVVVEQGQVSEVTLTYDTGIR
jgi:hypothetical protein